MAIAPYSSQRKLMKLRKLHIEDYKMFKDFDISFMDENDEPLPIIVLAGVNGSGKTTLLEYLLNYEKYAFSNFSTFMDCLTIKDNVGILYMDYETLKPDAEMYIHNLDFYTKNLLYYSTNTNIENIKTFLPKKIENMVYKEEIPPREAYKQIREYIDNILKNLNPQIEFDGRDGEGNLFFRNKSGGDKFSIDELSTGEKTLMSKVLYLYLEDIKDKVILIDEPELSLHPSWQNKVLKIYENFALKNNCQIIIATHSPHIIGSAENKYIRFLEKDKEANVRAINDIQAYGRDIEWILEQMDVADTRLPKITKRFEEIQELINNEEFDKADDALDKLEYVIGENDKDILALRNDLAFERMDFEEDN